MFVPEKFLYSWFKVEGKAGTCLNEELYYA